MLKYINFQVKKVNTYLLQYKYILLINANKRKYKKDKLKYI